ALCSTRRWRWRPLPPATASRRAMSTSSSRTRASPTRTSSCGIGWTARSACCATRGTRHAASATSPTTRVLATCPISTERFAPGTAPRRPRCGTLGRKSELPRLRGPIGAGGSPGRDVQTIPAVDRRDGEGQVRQLFLREELLHPVVHVVRHVPVLDVRDRVGPGQRRPFPIRVVRRLLPGVEPVEALLVLAGRPHVLPGHVDAVRAPVEL